MTRLITGASPEHPPETFSFYDSKFKLISGEDLSFSGFKGRKVLVVNTASHCVFTPQLSDLQELHSRFHQKLYILAFPSNNFFWQEPGSASTINSYYCDRFHVTFRIFEKVSVIGRNQHPLFTWLTKKSGKAPDWNFSKYLVDENADRVQFFSSQVNPLDQKIIDELK
jgi:glutathione peroxidase